MRPLLLGVLLAFLPAERTADAAPWCGMARISGYIRGDGNARTYDGTSIFTPEPIVAASWDVRMGTIADIAGLGAHRVADRGMLGNGVPLPWVDVAVWSEAEARSLTGVRTVCFRRPTS